MTNLEKKLLKFTNKGKKNSMTNLEKKLLKFINCLLQKYYSGKIVIERDVEQCFKRAGIDKIEANQLFRKKIKVSNKNIKFHYKQDSLF